MRPLFLWIFYSTLYKLALSSLLTIRYNRDGLAG